MNKIPFEFEKFIELPVKKRECLSRISEKCSSVIASRGEVRICTSCKKIHMANGHYFESGYSERKDSKR